ncbi:MAG: endopeptidase La [Acidobacteria bacterium RIFCSPLOWO2_02_FULL_60_20]|nr:MAG: endopeptidase La [Acidobacteria bacterium RIFCSPLOWO2_02_FULL_60_20]
MEPEKFIVTPKEVAVLPVRDTVLFPHAVLPLTIGRESSIEMIRSLGEEKIIAIVAQRDSQNDNPKPEDLYDVGTLAMVHKIIPMPNKSLFIFAEGLRRIRLTSYTQVAPFLKAQTKTLEEIEPERTPEVEALERSIVAAFQQIVAASPHLSDELQAIILTVEGPGRIADFVVSSLAFLNTRQRQELLETLDIAKRLDMVNRYLIKERQLVELRTKIESEVQDQMAQGQKEYYLREQLKAIQKELGGEEEGREVEELKKKIAEAGMPEEVEKEALRELQRFSHMSSAAAEYTISRTFLDWLVTLPWNRSSQKPISIPEAHGILETDHYNLDKVKERILEYLSVLQLKPEMKGPILCFVGPPGVGKTSLGKSIARALGRKFVRISLGGMHDEAEIRGHRRTYIGALPGQIIQGIRRAGTRDPVFMLDEVDKIGRDFRGDPAAALLEALDPEQNFQFRDHYLEVPFDLSKVLFITTANVLDPVPDALHDRMEVLELPGYTEEEKIEIAKRHVIPRQVEAHGLKLEENIQFTTESLAEVIRYYTREAGLRNLERNIATICRKQARRIAEGGEKQLVVDGRAVREALGAPKMLQETEVAERTERPGVAIGLAWTPAGGDILFIEANQMPGKHGLIMTGHLGQVMQESMQAALTWVRSHSEQWDLPPDYFENRELHMHVPAGAIPKDGPSAGVTMATALVSLLTRRRVRPNLAMTGEITLSGLVLPVGGIKEKVLAAKRAGITEVLLPKQNAVHVEEDLKKEQLEGLTLRYVKTMDEVIERALEPSGRNPVSGSEYEDREPALVP